MDDDPLSREKEFRRLIEQAAQSQRTARLRRERPGRVVVQRIANFLLYRLWLPVTLLVLLIFGGFFFVLFGFAIKWTEAYACSIAEARRSQAVIAQLGEPIDPGFFAWSFGYSHELSVTDTSFSTVLNGPKGTGTLRVRWYDSPVGSSLQMVLDKDGTQQSIYSGPIPCR
ncbi:MAG TPA: cytochrome c oxidase assembly factor Coa1 family protein [Pyrinomonadaceae bacterium]